MRRLHYLFLLAWTLGIGTGYGQRANDCKQLMSGYIKEMSAHTYPKQGKWFRIRAKVSTVPRKGSVYAQTQLSSTNLDVSIVIGTSSIFYESNYLAMYRDEKDDFTVVHPQKTILWKQAQLDPSRNKEVLSQTMVVQQQAFLQNSFIQQCKDTLYDGKLTKVIEVVPDLKVGVRHHIQRVIYYYVPSERKVKRQVVFFLDDYQLVRQEIIFLETDWNYRGKHPKSAYESVFAQRNKLAASFRSYRIEKQ